MKAGQVYKRKGTGTHYVVINDYGVPRPINLEGSSFMEANMAKHLCERWLWEKSGFYEGDVLVAERIEDLFQSSKWRSRKIKLNQPAKEQEEE